MTGASGPGSVVDPGPALAAGWEVWTTPAGRALRVVRDGDDPRSGWCLPQVPAVERTDGRPVLGLTLVLSRQPLAGEESVRDLVQLASLALGVSLAAPADLVQEVAAARGVTLRPLFARSVEFSLLGGDGLPWCSAAAAGPDASGALSVTLPRAGALTVLDALDGIATAASLRAVVTAQLGAATRTVRLSGRWVDVHDAWSVTASADGTVAGTQALAAVASLIDDGVVHAEVDGRGVTDVGLSDAASEVARALLRSGSFLLRRVAVPADGEPTYVLGARPSPYVPLGVTVRSSAPRTTGLTLDVPLHTLMGGLLDGLDGDAHVRMVVADPGPAGTVPARRRVDARPATRGPGASAQQLLHGGGLLRSLPLALTPDLAVQPRAAALVAGDAVGRSLVLGRDRRAYLLDDTIALLPVAVGEDERPLDLPLVADPAAATWPDRNDASRHWYAPSLDPVPVAPGDDPATSGFLFDVRPTGLSQDLRQGLEATLRVRLARTVPPAAAALALPAGDTLLPVPTSGLSATLDVPYRDSASGQTLSQPLTGTVVEEADGTLTVSVALLDDWARLCYGALSYPGFQSLPVRLRVGYAHRAYVPSAPGEMQVVAGGKVLELQAAVVRGDADDAVLRLAGTELRLQVEEPLPLQLPEPPEAAMRLRPISDGGETPDTIAHRIDRIDRPVVVVSPPILPPPPPPPEPVLRTLVREQTHDLLLPCADVGPLYRQLGPDGPVVLGCQDVLRLGETTNRQYAELTDLADPAGRYRLFSSLQQPGLFLVVPSAYRITRYGPDEPPERNFRPVALLYGEIGASTDQTRYQLRATLQPDLAVDVRHDIETVVAARTPFGHEPTLVFPTDPSLQADATYAWAALPHGDIPVVLRTWDDLQVTVSVPVTDALLLTRLLDGAGFTGQVTFTFADGQRVQSTLVLDSFVVGPWRSGPVPVVLGQGTATLTNRSERAMSVAELVTEDATGSRAAVTVEVALAAGESHDCTVPEGTVEAWVRAMPAGGSLDLATLDVFVEDLTTQLGVFGQVNFANHAIAALVVEVRLAASAPHVWSTPLSQGETAYLSLTFPVTTYLQADSLEYRVNSTRTDGPAVVTPWRSWNLQRQGVLISITAESVDPT